MWLLGLRGRGGDGLQYPRCYSNRVLFAAVIVAAGAAREAGGLAHGRARGKGFPS